MLSICSPPAIKWTCDTLKNTAFTASAFDCFKGIIKRLKIEQALSDHGPVELSAGQALEYSEGNEVVQNCSCEANSSQPTLHQPTMSNLALFGDNCSTIVLFPNGNWNCKKTRYPILVGMRSNMPFGRLGVESL